MLSRTKFEIAGLVKEILDQLPSDVWTSSTTTFMDPAIGGGQFVREIEKRLRDAGHDSENIASRVFGFEEFPHRIQYAINKDKKNKLVGNYQACDFLAKEFNMKFSVVVGNPPYQNPQDKVAGAKQTGNKLWYQFIFKADNLVASDGYLTMVTPTQWVSGGVNMRNGQLGVLKDLFSKKQLIIANMNNITETYFNGIGISIGWWVMKNTKINSPTKLIFPNNMQMSVDFTDLEFLSPNFNINSVNVVAKTLGDTGDKFETYYFNSHCAPDKHAETDAKTKLNKYSHWIMGSDVTNNLKVKFFPKILNERVNYKKVVFSMSTRYWQPYLANSSVSVAGLGQALKVPDNTTHAGFVSVFYSKLFKYLCFNLQIAQNGFMKTSYVKALPKLDLTRTWTDQELYQHFNLTQEEIEYIEKTVK